MNSRNVRPCLILLIFSVLASSRLDARQEKPAPAPPASNPVGSVQASGQVPDVQVVVGPGKAGWQVALVYPKKVDRSRVEQDIAAVATATGAPAVDPVVETRRLDRADSSKVGEAPSMTSATFETKANLVDYTLGRVAVETLVTALQEYNRIAIVFLVPGRFAWTGGTEYEDKRLRIDASVGEGALVFVANIRSRPLARFEFPGPAASRVSQPAPTVATKRVLSPFVAWIGAILAGVVVFAVVRWRLQK